MTIIIKSDLETPMYNAKLYLLDGTELGIADAWWQHRCGRRERPRSALSCMAP
jgi:hypothetical protein